MQTDRLNVFDLDGTIIRVNSFREVSKNLIFVLIRKRKIRAFVSLLFFYFIRKLRLISHLKFKMQVVDIFEKSLTEQEKQSIVSAVFNNNINKGIFDRMIKAENCVISTASPFAFASRMPFKRDQVLITSLFPDKNLPDPANFGFGKVENLKFFFRPDNVCVSNFYTDSTDDKELMDFSDNVFMVKNGEPVKLK